MKYYELSYLISPELNNEELRTLTQKVSDFVSQETGMIDRTIEPSRRQLGYPINKKTSAYLATIYFYVNAEKLQNIEKKLKGEANMLRHIVIQKKTPAKAAAAAEMHQRPRRHPPTSEKLSEQQKVELGDIEKKIEEILSE